MVRTVEEEGETISRSCSASPEVSLRESEREGVDGLAREASEASEASEGSPLSPSVSLDKVYSSSIFILLFVVRLFVVRPSVFRRLLFLGPLLLLLVLLHLRSRVAREKWASPSVTRFTSGDSRERGRRPFLPSSQRRED